MTNLQAALGLAQVERLEEFVARKRAMGRAYSEKLEKVSGLGLMPSDTVYAENIYWVFGVVLNEEIFIW